MNIATYVQGAARAAEFLGAQNWEYDHSCFADTCQPDKRELALAESRKLPEGEERIAFLHNLGFPLEVIS